MIPDTPSRLKMNNTPQEEIDTLIHKAVDQLSVIKAAVSFITAGGNGDSLSDMKNATSKLKDIDTQLGKSVEEFEKLINAKGRNHA